MTRNNYIKLLQQKGYRISENTDLVFLDTPYGVWVQKLEEYPAQKGIDTGFGLASLLNPASGEPVFKLTATGRKNARDYIREIILKRKEILVAGKDTANDTVIPTVEDIEEDINFLGLDSSYEYCNGWGVTDNYDTGYPLLLKLGRDIEVEKYEVKEIAEPSVTSTDNTDPDLLGSVDTSAGIIRAYKLTDPGNPGICIMLQPAGYEQEIDVAHVSVYEDTEYATSLKERPLDVVIHTYGDASTEDYTTKEIIRREVVMDSLKD